MFKLLALAALAVLLQVLQAQTSTYLRYGAGSCMVTGVTNASPPVVTCDADPGLTSGNRVRVTSVLSAGPVYSSVNGSNFVNKLTATTYALYSDAGLTTPLAAPGAFVSSPLPWMGKEAQAVTIPASPRAVLPVETINALRRDVSSGTLTNIVVASNVGTINIPNGVAEPHNIRVG